MHLYALRLLYLTKINEKAKGRCTQAVLLPGDVRNRLFLFRFGFLSVFKNSDSVRNEFCSVQLKNAVRFGYYS